MKKFFALAVFLCLPFISQARWAHTIFELEKYGSLGVWMRNSLLPTEGHIEYFIGYDMATQYLYNNCFYFILRFGSEGWSEDDRSRLRADYAYSSFKNSHPEKYQAFIDRLKNALVTGDPALFDRLKELEKTDRRSLIDTRCLGDEDDRFALEHKADIPRIVKDHFPEFTQEQRALLCEPTRHEEFVAKYPDWYAFFLRRFRRQIEKETGEVAVCIHCNPANTHENCWMFHPCRDTRFICERCRLMLDEFQMRERVKGARFT